MSSHLCMAFILQNKNFAKKHHGHMIFFLEQLNPLKLGYPSCGHGCSACQLLIFSAIQHLKGPAPLLLTAALWLTTLHFQFLSGPSQPQITFPVPEPASISYSHVCFRTTQFLNQLQSHRSLFLLLLLKILLLDPPSSLLSCLHLPLSAALFALNQEGVQLNPAFSSA